MPPRLTYETDDSSTTVESSIEKEVNEVEKIGDSISVSENTESKTPYNNEPKDGKSSEKKCKLEPQNINISP